MIIIEKNNEIMFNRINISEQYQKTIVYGETGYERKHENKNYMGSVLGGYLSSLCSFLF